MPTTANKEDRDTIFISHATPSDNAFATWLATRLSLAGYKVWCDQEKLLGGEDFWNDIQQALRHRTAKFILVVSQFALQEDGSLRDGIAKEVALAEIIKKQLSDPYFIVPMRIDATSFSDFPIDFVRLNGIDCQKNWADGLSRMLKVLERDSIFREVSMADKSLSAWQSIHKHKMSALTNNDEVLQTNWLSIERLPEHLYFYDIQISVKPNEPRAIAKNCPLPCFHHGRLLASCAKEDEFQNALGEGLPVKLRGKLKTTAFMGGHTGDILGLKPPDARNKISSLVRQGIDNYFQSKGLTAYEMANGSLAWWFKGTVIEDGQLRYTDFNGKARKRTVGGTYGKKLDENKNEITRYYWHLGFTAKPYISKKSTISLRPRIIISEDGETPLKNKVRLNSARRTVTKLWFNDKWRGLILGFSTWIADGNATFQIPLSETQSLSINSRPITLGINTGIRTDPASDALDDEIAEREDLYEANYKISDPAFYYDDDEKEAG